jgi:hypothetical protein
MAGAIWSSTHSPSPSPLPPQVARPSVPAPGDGARTPPRWPTPAPAPHRGGRTSSHAALGPRSSAAPGAPPLALLARSPPRRSALRRAHMPLSIRPRRQPPPLLPASPAAPPYPPTPPASFAVAASPAGRRAGRLFPVPATDEGRCEGERREEGESEDTEPRC